MPPSASTDRSMVPVSLIVKVAPLTVKPEAEPVIDKASASPIRLSVFVVRVNVPDFAPVPAAITTSKDASSAGME